MTTLITPTDADYQDVADLTANFAALNADKAEIAGQVFTGAVAFSGTGHAGLKVNSLTTTQRNALTPAVGMIIYNSTVDEIQKYTGTAWASMGGIETGDVLASNKSTKAGFLPCDGAAVSRSTYADLFAVVSTTFGAGDGSTTFNVPYISPDPASVIKQDSVTAITATSAASKTYAHTCSGSNRLLLVAVNTTTDVCTGVTYAGAAMTQLAKKTATETVYLYGLLNPATGANNVVVSASGSTSIYSGAVSFIGVVQSGLPDAVGTAAGAAVTLTTVLPNTTAVIVGDGATAGAGAYLLTTYNGIGMAVSDPFNQVNPGAHTLTLTSATRTIAASFANISTAGRNYFIKY